MRVRMRLLAGVALIFMASNAHSESSCHDIALFSAVSAVREELATSSEVMDPGVLNHLQRECDFGKNVYKAGARGGDYVGITFDHGVNSYPGMSVGHMHAMTTALLLAYAISDGGVK